MIGVASLLSSVINRTWGGARNSNVIVVGRLEEQDVETGGFRLGCHLHCTNTLVSREEALKLRTSFVDALKQEQGIKYDWDSIVDASVYKHLTLRLLGCIKPGLQKRLYDLIGVVGENGYQDYKQEGDYRNDRLQLLFACSIRVKD